jgi:hypothetical protein
MHLFVDITRHGFGHLAITAPILNALAEMAPDLRLTVRSQVPAGILHERIKIPFQLIEASTDFGYVMHDATQVDLPASAAAYRSAHQHWVQRVKAEARFLASLQPDGVLTNVSYLPLAGAAAAGIPSLSLCSLNWADLFAHFFAGESWALPIHAEMLAAYRSAQAFLRVTPGMPMPDLPKVKNVGPVAAIGQKHALGLGSDKAVLVAMGGISHQLPVDRWPRLPGIRWIVAADSQCTHLDAITSESFGLSFTDLLCSVDAIVSKPGYGTFTEAACNGTPVLYQQRADWPEQDCLIEWLHEYGRCQEISPNDFLSGQIKAPLELLWQTPAPARPISTGSLEAAQIILTTFN